MIDLAAAFANEPPQLDFIWPGGPLSGTVAAIAAPGGAGKSFWALEAAMAVSGAGVPGSDLLGLRPEVGGQVLYLALEDPEPVLQHRLFAIGQHLHQAAREAIADRLILLPMAGSRWKVDSQAGERWLNQAAAGMRLIIIDTLSRAHTLDENSNRDMGFLLHLLEHIATANGSTIMYLHHTSKAVSMSGLGDHQHAARGASVLIDNARWGGYIATMTPGEASKYRDPWTRRRLREEDHWRYVRAGASKINYCQPEGEKWFERSAGGVLIPAQLEFEHEQKNVRSIKSVKKELRDDDF